MYIQPGYQHSVKLRVQVLCLTMNLAGGGRPNGAAVCCVRKLLCSALILLSIGTIGGRQVLQVNVVSPQLFDPNLTLGLAWTGAALHLAVQRVNVRYADQGLRFVVRPVEAMYNATCAQTALDGIPVFVDYYYRHTDHDADTCNIFFTNSCMDYFQLQCLSFEWNAFLFNNGLGTSLGLPDRSAPAYLLNLSGTEAGLAQTLMRTLRYFGWSHLAFLLDQQASTPLHRMMVAAAQVTALADGQANSNNASLAVFEFRADNKETIVSGLLRAKQVSRVFVLGSSTAVAYFVMDLASQLGMTNGEYVFFNIQPVQNAVYGKVSYFNNPTPLMLNLTWNLIFITFHEAEDTDYDRALNRDLRRLTYDLYNVTYEAGLQPLSIYPARTTYNSIELIAQTMAANLDNYTGEGGAFCRGDRLAQMLFNRTFHLPNANISVDATGLSFMDNDIWLYNSATRNMTLYAVFRPATGAFELTHTFESDWPTGQPPSDIPACGFSGQEGPCSNRGQTALSINIILPAVAGAIVVVMGVCCATALVFRRSAGRAARSQYWWLLDDKDFHRDLAATEVANPVQWKNQLTWVTRLPLEGRPNLQLLRQIIPDTAHANVNALLGMLLLPDRALLVADYCRRGSLAALLDVMKLDQDFQLAMARDLAKGLEYLHVNVKRPHGCLSSGCCLIDDRFTLRIAKFAFPSIGQVLSAKTPHDDPDATLTDDIKAAGMIILLLARQPLSKPVSRLSNMQQLDEADVVEYGVHSQLVILAHRCTHSTDIQRPTAKELLRSVGKVRAAGQQQSAGTSIVESILRRFETYTQTLNEAVRMKSEELQSEQRKCDELLMEVLPRMVVDKLRNRQPLAAEYYARVTVFFSDLEGFVHWVASVRPEVVLGTVTALFGAFDRTIQPMDVYKVETVRDSYMVVSGIPVRTGDQHAAEICRMAVRLMMVFQEGGYGNGPTCSTDPSSPALQLRCGVHSGPCAAGIVGRRVPRYCLFGDTVNVASRMNSQGQGGRIHLSQATQQMIAGDVGVTFRIQERGLLFVKLSAHHVSLAFLLLRETFAVSCCDEQMDALGAFLDVYPDVQLIAPDLLDLLGSPLLPSGIVRSIMEKLEILETMINRLDILPAHQALFLLKNCLAVPKLLYLLRTSECWKHDRELDRFDRLIRTKAEDITNVQMTEAIWKQASLPLKHGGLGLISASDIALPAYLASLTAASVYIEGIISNISASDLTAELVREWSSRTELEPPAAERRHLQTAWTSALHTKALASMMETADVITSSRLLAVSSSESRAWLSALPVATFGNLLEDSHLRIAVALRLGAEVCKGHRCICKTQVDVYGHHGLVCKRSKGRHPRHSALNDVVRRALISANIPAIREPPGLDRGDGKRPDGMTLMPWKSGKPLVWDVTVADTCADSYIARTSTTCGAAADQRERQKETRYSALSDRYHVQPIGLETMGSWGPRATVFLKEIGRRIRESNGNPRSMEFLRQRISIEIQRGNGICVLGTVDSTKEMEDVYLVFNV